VSAWSRLGTDQTIETYGDPAVEAEEVVDSGPNGLRVEVGRLGAGDERSLESFPVVGYPERDLLVKQIRTVVSSCTPSIHPISEPSNMP
jgi:hypothetical protein